MNGRIRVLQGDQKYVYGKRPLRKTWSLGYDIPSLPELCTTLHLTRPLVTHDGGTSLD